VPDTDPVDDDRIQTGVVAQSLFLRGTDSHEGKTMRACLFFMTFLIFGSAWWQLLTTPVMGENWSQFRGANTNGVAVDAKLPVEWAQDKRIIWRARLPGLGWSQPVVWDDQIFVTTAVSDKQPKPDPEIKDAGFSGLAGFLSSGGLHPPEVSYRWKVLCIGAAAGRVVWERDAREGRPKMQIHPNNTYASETPVTDGERLIAYFGMTGVYCYDLSGTLNWSKDLGAYPTQFGWGTGSSPILYGDDVYIQCDNDTASFLVALNKFTGEEIWRVERDEKSNWSTPYIWKNKLRTELIAAGGNQMRSYDPKTGALLWEMTGSGRTSITPVGDEELLYIDSYDRPTGGSGIFAAIRPGAAGDISLNANETSNSHVAWSAPLTGYRVASPLLYQGCLYILENQSGIVRCLDAITGEERYRKRLSGTTGFTASPLADSGRVYLVDQNCRTTVVEAGPELRIVATNDLDEMCWSSPAVAGEHLLIRTVDHLYSIGEK
jgi:outer membrane protein assembly factor BamB